MDLVGLQMNEFAARHFMICSGAHWASRLLKMIQGNVLFDLRFGLDPVWIWVVIRVLLSFCDVTGKVCIGRYLFDRIVWFCISPLPVGKAQLPSCSSFSVVIQRIGSFSVPFSSSRCSSVIAWASGSRPISERKEMRSKHHLCNVCNLNDRVKSDCLLGCGIVFSWRQG